MLHPATKRDHARPSVTDCSRHWQVENVMVTSWGWLLLTDLANYKPALLPQAHACRPRTSARTLLSHVQSRRCHAPWLLWQQERITVARCSQWRHAGTVAAAAAADPAVAATHTQDCASVFIRTVLRPSSRLCFGLHHGLLMTPLLALSSTVGRPVELPLLLFLWRNQGRPPCVRPRPRAFCGNGGRRHRISRR